MMSHKIKKIIFSITGVLVLICMYISLNKVENQSQPATARVDISEKTANSNPCFEVREVSTKKLLTPAKWMPKFGQQGYMIQKETMSEELEITATSDKCKINFALRGPWELKDKKDRNKGIKEHWVEYTKFAINGQDIITKPTSAWHNKPIYHSITAQKGNVFNVKINWQKIVIPLSTIEKLILWGINLTIVYSIYLILFTRKKQLALSAVLSSLCMLGGWAYTKEQGIRFDFYGFIILATFVFFVIYKIIKYLSRFKIEEHHSRIDIVFCTVFFILLFAPMLYISDAEKSNQENRMLAKYKPIFQNNKFNLNFGKDFDAWFSDRFWGRDYFIKLNDNIKYALQQRISNNKAIMAEDRMIFSKYILKGMITPLSDKEYNKMIINFRKLRDFAENNGIKLYILIPPSKEDIFSFKLSHIYTQLDTARNIKELKKRCSLIANINLIYPREIYEKQHSEFTHFKTDHHWTEYGAFLGYQELIKAISLDYPALSPLELKDFNIFYKKQPRLGSFKGLFNRPFYMGSDCQQLNLSSKQCPHSDKYAYYDYKYPELLDVKNGPIKMSRITHFESGFPKRVTIVGNSYGGFLMQFLAYTFKDVQMLRVNNGEKNVKNEHDFHRFEKHILNFKTDILIYYLSSSYIRSAQQIYED